uniref:Uncharacterized protein n=1 Tax=Arundo donax TaxID=35708 RepID=A0A0A9BI78_ARUDO
MLHQLSNHLTHKLWATCATHPLKLLITMRSGLGRGG